MKRPTHLHPVPSELHPLQCNCAFCEQYFPPAPNFAHAARDTWILLLAGFALGLLVVLAIAGIDPVVRLALLGS